MYGPYAGIYSYKYSLIEADWFTPLGHLLGKVKKKMLLLHPHPVLCGILKELCGIRDNTSSCDIANNNDIVALINDIMTMTMTMKFNLFRH